MQSCGRCKQDKDLEGYSPSYRGKPGTWCRACFAEYNRMRKQGRIPTPSVPVAVTLMCIQCGSAFSPVFRRQATVFCSRKCKDDASNAAAASVREAGKPDRSCVHCGGAMPRSMRSDAKFCSEACNSAAHAVTRKIAKRSGRSKMPGDPLLERNAIATRDKFRCGICGGRVDMKLSHPDPMYGSIDHIVPLAAGGSNDLANLQLAHLRCNLAKQDRGSQQLRLLG